ncbi:Transmembrane protein 184C [Seminavis robusta]|uniref:Transmembrane protein 184C n=1 Tax=Seminavis robusta TaxID=568900 RepID=A0A9N8EAA8_9STRA|nr:Transmembrane protein 184C [Seminavis robusta]|eukprot:Sro803_g204750.1 Transmembrane protein 184C (812) ;mRNA; f:18093-20850
MLNSFRTLQSNLLEEDDRNEEREERRNLLDGSSASAEGGVADVAPVSGTSLASTGTTVTTCTAASTGMNPQDDLEQQAADDNNINSGSTATTPIQSNHADAKEQERLLGRKQPQSLQAGNSAGLASVVARRRGRRRKRRNRSGSNVSEKDKDLEYTNSGALGGPLDALCSTCLRTLCFDRTMVRNTLSCMNVMARVVVWFSVFALAAGVVWYSYELKNNGTDTHLIAWFSAGAFVLLGFPLSMGSIVAHLANYNQPHVQCYIVRILWMVPMYSMESWLCLRFHQWAIYIETLRDCYESFVLYSFFQFLIEVLGGEEALILMLKDKSPTRGSHMWGLQWCVKPWLMGQPVRRSDDLHDKNDKDKKKLASSPQHRHRNSLKRVHWNSPFFVQCKFGVLQYVLLKFVCSFLACIFETHGIYKEGDFTYKGGYLYICIVTNLSQCWALYCLILFYYATHNELGPIRPIGKFLSVKALVFFTWWQSVGIGLLYQWGLIPHYNPLDLSPGDVAKGIQDYLICVEMFFAAIVHTLVFPHSEYSPQAVQARARALNQSATNPNLWKQRKRLGRHHQYPSNHVLRNYQRDDKSSHSESRGSKGDRSFFDLEMTTLSAERNGVVESLSWENPPTGEEDVESPISPNRMRLSSVESMESDWGSTPHSSIAHYSEWEGLSDPQYSRSPQESRAQEHPPSIMQPVLNESHGTGIIDEGVDEDGRFDGAEEYDEELSSDCDLSDEFLDESSGESKPRQKQSFVRAFLDSAIPRDLRDNTVGIVKGDYVVEKKTLLHHATTSDHYDLFSQTRRANFRTRTKEQDKD